MSSADVERGIESARSRLVGSFSTEVEYDDVRASLATLVADAPKIKSKLNDARMRRDRVRSFLDKLPEGARLEPVLIDASGHDLEKVRQERKACEAEVLELRAIPTPSADIRQRLEENVYSAARPQITGIGEGEQLKIIWPGAGWDTKGPIEHRADAYPVLVLAIGDAIVAGLMRVVEDMANAGMPAKERTSDRRRNRRRADACGRGYWRTQGCQRKNVQSASPSLRPRSSIFISSKRPSSATATT